VSKAPERLRAVDLNLLPILRELLRTRSVTRTAQALDMGQPAVSEALKRLRRQFDDDLLVRSGRAMQPTALAHELAPIVEQLLSQLQTILAPPFFEPTVVEREFIIATADSIILTIGAALIQRLAHEAPHISVQCVDLQWVDERALHTGELDFIILPRPAVDAAGRATTIDTAKLESLLLFEEEFVCIARRGHPTATPGADLEQALTVAYRADPDSALFGLLPGSTRPVILVPQFSLLPFLVAGSDAVALIQRHLAEMFAEVVDIEIVRTFDNIPRVQVCAFWAPVHTNDPAHRWFRTVLHDVSPQRTT
jgi:LysR family nod box-dependent transcriptional activator